VSSRRPCAIFLPCRHHADTLAKTVNELSNTIDLHVTLVQAEALFRRFQRTVEAVDRKHSFPPPSTAQLRHRRPADADTDASTDANADVATATASGNDANSGPTDDAGAPQQQQQQQQQHDAPEEAQGEELAVGAKSPDAVAKGKAPAREMLPDVVSPELRALLNRERTKVESTSGDG
jgi:hypothetical protein